MRVAVFSTKPYDRRFLDAANAAGRHELVYLAPGLDELKTTFANLDAFAATGRPLHQVSVKGLA